MKQMEELRDDIKMHLDLDRATPTHIEYWEVLFLSFLSASNFIKIFSKQIIVFTLTQKMHVCTLFHAMTTCDQVGQELSSFSQCFCVFY